MTFRKKYSDIKELALPEISTIENIISESINIAQPLKSYILKFLNTHAKRVRLVLPVLFIKSFSQKLSDKQLKALAAVEIVHNASLIHDDIIDESKIRRGIETVYEKFGSKLGVIAGDYLLSLAMNIIVELNNNELLKSFSDTLNKMCTGEINQNFNRYKIGTIEEYIEKSKNKTAYLFETAMLSPVLFCDLTDDAVKSSACEYGLNTGIAFQIRDDLKNLTETDSDKPSSSDIKEGIYNAPVIFAGSVENYYAGIEKTKILLNNYIEKARADLSILPQNAYKNGLKEFLEILKNE